MAEGLDVALGCVQQRVHRLYLGIVFGLVWVAFREFLDHRCLFGWTCWSHTLFLGDGVANLWCSISFPDLDTVR